MLISETAQAEFYWQNILDDLPPLFYSSKATASLKEGKPKGLFPLRTAPCISQFPGGRSGSLPSAAPEVSPAHPALPWCPVHPLPGLPSQPNISNHKHLGATTSLTKWPLGGKGGKASLAPGNKWNYHNLLKDLWLWAGGSWVRLQGLAAPHRLWALLALRLSNKRLFSSSFHFLSFFSWSHTWAGSLCSCQLSISPKNTIRRQAQGSCPTCSSAP